MGLSLPTIGVPGLFGGSTAYSTSFAGSAGNPGDGWTGTWQLDGSGNLVPVVSLGGDLFDTNKGNFADGSTGSWVAGGTNTIAADPGGGADSELKITYVDTGNAATLNLTAVSDLSAGLTQGRPYLYTGEMRVNAGSSVLFAKDDISAAPVSFATVTAVALTATTFTTIPNAAAPYLRVQSMGAGEIAWVDNQTMKAISGYLEVRAFATAYGQFTLAFTRTASTQFGVVLNYTDINNFAMVYADGAGRLIYGKIVAGTWTRIALVSMTYSAGASLVVTRHQNGTVDLTYNGTSLATAQTASGLTGTSFGIIGTDNSSQAHSFAYTTQGVS